LFPLFVQGKKEPIILMKNNPIKKCKSCDVLLVGRYFSDLIFTELPEMPRLGYEVYCKAFRLVPGGAANSAIALSRLGLNVAWPCEFGSDLFSQYVRGELIKEGVDQNYFSVSEKPSIHITVAFSFQNDRSFLSYMDLIQPQAYQELIRKANPGWVYITHLMLGNDLKEIAFAARDVGAKIYMDCQAHSSSLEDRNVIEALRRVDVFSPNAEEALTLTGKKDLNSALTELAKFVPSVIIKCGLEGCIANHAGEVNASSAISVDVKDTTGAGDNFNCGFLFGQIKKYSFIDSLRIANICAGLSTRGYGGSETSPSASELADWFLIE
jgi:sugar/nucleoside kinase (ribokinase family)